MKKILFILLFIFGLIACNKNSETTNKNEKKLKIVTTLFPTYDFSKQLGGENVEVKLLLPPGIEAHSYEPTPRDISDINNADIFIYTGNIMEPWVEKLLKSLSNKNLLILDVSKGIELKQFQFEDHHDHEKTGEIHNDKEEVHGKDPHIWTDPILAKVMVQNIFGAMVEKDVKNKAFYGANKLIYDKKLDDLNNKFLDLSLNAKKKEIISGGHFVFGYLINRYGFEYHSAYEGFSPNAEPTPKQMKALKETIKETGTKYVYFEELIDPKLARLLSEELGLKMLLLHGAHNISKEEIEKNVTYYDIMLKNIENLKLGFEYGK